MTTSDDQGKRDHQRAGGLFVNPNSNRINDYTGHPVDFEFLPCRRIRENKHFLFRWRRVSNFAFLGLDSSFIRFFYDPPKSLSNKTMALLALCVATVVNCTLIFIILLTCPKMAAVLLFGESNTPALIVLGVYIAGSIAFRMSNTIARMRSEVRDYNLQQILQNLISKFLFAIAVLVSTNFFPSIVVMALGTIAVSTYFLTKQRENFGLDGSHPSRSDIKLLFAFGIPCCINGLVLILSTSIGKIILGWLGLFEDAGVLAIAMTIASAFSLLPQAFSLYWSPFVYKNHAAEHARIREMHDYVMAAALVATCVIVVGQDALYMLVGPGYASSQSYFMLLMTAPIATLICETTGYGTMLANKPIYVSVISIIGIIINALLTFVLASVFGGFAAGVAVCVSSIFICLAKSITGQLFYPCINSIARSSISAGAILLLCLGNCLFYDSWGYKAISIVLTSCVLAFCYRREIGKVRTLFGDR